MIDKILLNEEVYIPSESILPCLIPYGDKSGGSHFSVTFVAQLFASGSKILFFTAYHMAKDNFYEQVGENPNIAFVTNVEELEQNKNAQCIILESGNEELFIKALEILPDINERVILMKNIENFTSKAFEKTLDLPKVIISGNLDDCTSKDKIVDKKYNSIIVFTKPAILLSIEVPELEKYTAYFWTKEKQGIMKIVK